MTPRSPARPPIHATTVAVRRGGGWRGVMILGASGAGKSDLALRLTGRGWRLVSDDYTQVWPSAGALYARAPAAIAGRIEVRGLGIVSAATRPLVRVALALDCAPGPLERLPEPQQRDFVGVRLPFLTLDPRPASAVDVVAAALETL